MVRRLSSIYFRLIIPLGVTLLLAMLAAWAIAVQLLTDTINRRLDVQLDHATAMLADGEFPFSLELIRGVAIPEAHHDLISQEQLGKSAAAQLKAPLIAELNHLCQHEVAGLRSHPPTDYRS